jgi:hypothetical protein
MKNRFDVDYLIVGLIVALVTVIVVTEYTIL